MLDRFWSAMWMLHTVLCLEVPKHLLLQEILGEFLFLLLPLLCRGSCLRPLCRAFSLLYRQVLPLSLLCRGRPFERSCCTLLVLPSYPLFPLLAPLPLLMVYLGLLERFLSIRRVVRSGLCWPPRRDYRPLSWTVGQLFT